MSFKETATGNDPNNDATFSLWKFKEIISSKW